MTDTGTGDLVSPRDKIFDAAGLNSQSSRYYVLRDALDAYLAEEKAKHRAEVLTEEADKIVSWCDYHGPDDIQEGWPDCHCVVADELRRQAKKMTEPPPD